MKILVPSFYKDGGGFSVVELLFVLTLVLVLTSLALMGASKARNTMQMNGAAELVKGSIERAFTDSRRRHAAGSDRSRIAVTSTTTFDLSLDLTGDGNPETRSVALP